MSKSLWHGFKPWLKFTFLLENYINSSVKYQTTYFPHKGHRHSLDIHNQCPLLFVLLYSGVIDVVELFVVMVCG